MISEGLQHSLSFVVRFNNHFSAEPVHEELPVRIDHTFTRPVNTTHGNARHGDGTYRFINISNGIHRVRWLPALEKSFKGWVSWEDDPLVHLPLANPADLISRDLWPLACAVVPPGVTAVRGRLVGPDNSDLNVQIEHTTTAFASTRFTHSDDIGDFLFLLPQPLKTDSTGQLELEIEVENGARPVTGGDFFPASSGAPFAADEFLVPPGKTSRVFFRIT